MISGWLAVIELAIACSIIVLPVRGGEKAPGALQGVGVNTAGKDFARGRGDGVISARETRDGIEQDDDVALVLDQALGFFQHHFGDLDMALRRFVEGGADDFAFHRALHVGDFLGPLVDQENDQGDFGMIGGDRVGERLQHHGFSGARRRDDQSALPLADRAQQVQHAPGKIFARRFHLQAPRRVQRRQVVKEDLVARDFGILEIDRFDFNQGEVALAVLGRADLAGDGVAGAQIEFADLRRRNVNIVRAGQVIVFRRAQKAEAVGQAFQHALGKDQTVLLRLGAEDLEDQLLLAHAAGARDSQILGDFRQIRDVFLFQFRKTNTHRFHFLNRVRALLEARPILSEDKPEDQAGIVLLGGLRAGACQCNGGLQVEPAPDFRPD